MCSASIASMANAWFPLPAPTTTPAISPAPASATTAWFASLTEAFTARRAAGGRHTHPDGSPCGKGLDRRRHERRVRNFRRSSRQCHPPLSCSRPSCYPLHRRKWRLMETIFPVVDQLRCVRTGRMYRAANARSLQIVLIGVRSCNQAFSRPRQMP